MTTSKNPTHFLLVSGEVRPDDKFRIMQDPDNINHFTRIYTAAEFLTMVVLLADQIEDDNEGK